MGSDFQIENQRRQLMSQGRRNKQLPRVSAALLDAMWRQVRGERGREMGRERFDDDMLSRVAREDVGGDLEVRYWRDGSQLEEQLAAAMKKHLKLTGGGKAYIPFNASLGLEEDSKQNNPLLAERWQILSPVRNHQFGTTEINRKIQAKYRGGMLNVSKNGRGKKPKPFGEQEIVFTEA